MEKSATKPYTRTGRRNEAQEPHRPKENRSKRQAMEQDIPLTQEPPFADSLTEENTLTNRGKKGSRQYQYDPWNKIKALNTGITIEELVEIAPAVRPFLQNRIRSTKPTYTAVNTVDRQGRTPAYAAAKIRGRVVNVILDTGA